MSVGHTPDERHRKAKAAHQGSLIRSGIQGWRASRIVLQPQSAFEGCVRIEPRLVRPSGSTAGRRVSIDEKLAGIAAPPPIPNPQTPSRIIEVGICRQTHIESRHGHNWIMVAFGSCRLRVSVIRWYAHHSLPLTCTSTHSYYIHMCRQEPQDDNTPCVCSRPTTDPPKYRLGIPSRVRIASRDEIIVPVGFI